MSRGRLIVFEGPEGAGKTTQLGLLAAWLTSRGIDHVRVREPGGTALGDEARRLLLDTPGGLDPRAEALLFMASRAALVAAVIAPALERGTLVLADRYFLSTYAYQIAGRGLPESEVRSANALATAGVSPDLTLLFAVPAPERAARAAARGLPDRIERAGDAFHGRVERAFAMFLSPNWQAAHPEAGPVRPIDGGGDAESVFARVRAALGERWPDLAMAGAPAAPAPGRR
ncbi:MAG TPA: dTMP kinase [Gemmatimonadaceae bacterium]|jgi:dTMP kinase